MPYITSTLSTDALEPEENECDLDSLNYDLGCFLFKNHSASSRHFLYFMYRVLSSINEYVNTVTLYLSVFAIIVSIFHLAVLAQPPMLTSSANIILLGIVICEMFTLLNNIKAFTYPYVFHGDLCEPPTSLISYQTNVIVDNFLATFRRCSPWLGVSLASVRFFAVRFFMISETFIRPRTGVLSILVSFLFSALFSVCSWTQISIIKTKTWIANETCVEQSESPVPVYTLDSDDTFFGSEETLLTMFTFWNGMFSKLIPSVLLLILSVLLIVELAKTKSMRSHASSGEGVRKDRTTTLITVMTVSFLIAEVPLALIIAAESYYLDDDDLIGIHILLPLTANFWNAISTLNAAFHCLICFGLSAQYRETAGRLFRNPFKRREHRVDFLNPRTPSDRSSDRQNSRSHHSM